MSVIAILRQSALIPSFRFLPSEFYCWVCGCYRNADMARKEGVRRIVTTGKLILSIGMTLGVLSAVMMYIQYPAAVYGVSIAFRVAALGGLVWAAGWIADGFTTPDP